MAAGPPRTGVAGHRCQRSRRVGCLMRRWSAVRKSDSYVDLSSTVVFPLPMDIIGPLLERFGPQAGLPEANEDEDGE